ncbi:MAG: hypothetical protein C0490_21375, partial [Marivirga sp.]|nr:hypothetical protein [Marivirga sp.]
QQLKNYESVSSQSNTNLAGGGAYLYQNSPNPFTTTTEIKMEIPDGSAHAQVIIYNLEGKQLKNIQVNERGTTKVHITANDLSAGMYLYSLMVDGKVADTKRLILTE